MKQLIILLSVTLAIALGAIARKSTGQQGRIFGGTPIDIRDRSFQLSLLFTDIHNCGAILISSEYALTAAHCTIYFNHSLLSVRAGSSIRNSGGVVYEISEIHEHPEFNIPVELANDISILKFATPVNESVAQPAVLPSANDTVEDGAAVTISGWGFVNNSGHLPDELMSVSHTTLSQTECARIYRDNITDSMLCAGTTVDGVGPCYGDSGGPLTEDGTNRLLALLSWAQRCATPRYPTVYTRIPSFMEFISNVTGL